MAFVSLHCLNLYTFFHCTLVICFLCMQMKAKPKEMDLPNVRNGFKWEMVVEE